MRSECVCCSNVCHSNAAYCLCVWQQQLMSVFTLLFKLMRSECVCCSNVCHSNAAYCLCVWQQQLMSVFTLLFKLMRSECVCCSNVSHSNAAYCLCVWQQQLDTETYWLSADEQYLLLKHDVNQVSNNTTQNSTALFHLNGVCKPAVNRVSNNTTLVLPEDSPLQSTRSWLGPLNTRSWLGPKTLHSVHPLG